MFIGVKTGLDEFFIKEASGVSATFPVGFPSTAIIVGFIIFSLAGIITVLGLENKQRYLKILGGTIVAIGFIGLVGYATGSAFLRYDIPGYSPAIAFHAAILMFLLGLGLVIVSMEDKIG